MSTIIAFPRSRTGVEASLDIAHPEVVGDRDLLPAAIVLWVVSVVRVAYGFADGETFTVEAVLALLCVPLVPWLCLASYRDEVRRRESSPESAENAPGRHGGAYPARVIPMRLAEPRERRRRR